jgi:hypothetical protein
MTFRNFCVLVLLVLSSSPGLLAQSQSDLKGKVKLFCDEKVKLTEQSINFDIQKLVSVQAGNKAAAAVDSVSTVQIATMHLNCNLLVGGFISSEQFLTKQTEVLQFGVELEGVRQEAEAKKAAELKTNTAASGSPSSSSTGSVTSQNSSDGTNEPASGASKETTKESASSPKTGKKAVSTGVSGASNDNKKESVSSSGVSQKPANLDLNAIANDLGVKLKKKAAVAQSGSDDLVQSSMQRIIQNYSGIPNS